MAKRRSSFCSLCETFMEMIDMAFTALMMLSFLAGFACGCILFGSKDDDDGKDKS